jgi:AraC family transcriptional regulator
MKRSTRQHYKEQILRVLVHIQEHLDEQLSLETLARVACFSPYHFHRIFRGMVGESVKEHVRRLRLERAAHRLIFTNQQIIRIALDAGYETHESFTRAFGQKFGESPSQFREIHRPPPFPPSPSGVHYVADGALDDFQPAKTDGPILEVRIESIEPMRVAFIRHVGCYEEIGTTWERFMQWAARKGMLRPGQIALGIVHDDPVVTPSDRIRYDACLVVCEDFQGSGDVGVQQISGGEYAIITHKGPHERLGETYDRFFGTWVPDSGRELRWEPAFEVYRNSPQDTRPDDLLTYIYVPLAPC